MRFIDNKRMSIIIGCTAGILVFIFIIISIVMNREEKEDDEDGHEDDSMDGSGPHKDNVSSKTNRSDSLTFTPRVNHRITRNNSQSSSLLNNRMSLVEQTTAGPDLSLIHI